MLLACDFTVSGAMPNDCAIRLFDIPSAIICKMPVSRRESERQLIEEESSPADLDLRRVAI
jgi:hypothetical protein